MAAFYQFPFLFDKIPLSIKIVICLLLSLISETISCRGGGVVTTTDTTVPTTTTKRTTTVDLNKVTFDENDLGHWAIPTGSGLSDKDIKNAYEEDRKTRDEKYEKWVQDTSSAEKKKPKDEAKDWPSEWNWLGPPDTGDAPPKWAVIKAGAPKPDLCFEPPLRGPGTQYVYRYGYNPYTERCEKYIYGNGGGGSNNNFYTKSRCEEICISTKKPCERCEDSPKLAQFEDWYDMPRILPNMTKRFL